MTTWIAFWRAFRGYCPTCNLDAPEIDNCPTCENYRGDWPPPRSLSTLWLHAHFSNLEQMEDRKD